MGQKQNSTRSSPSALPFRPSPAMNNQVRYISNLRTRTDDDEREKSLYRFDEVAARGATLPTFERSERRHRALSAPILDICAPFERNVSELELGGGDGAAEKKKIGAPTSIRCPLASLTQSLPHSLAHSLTHSAFLPSLPSFLSRFSVLCNLHLLLCLPRRRRRPRRRRSRPIGL